MKPDLFTQYRLLIPVFFCLLLIGGCSSSENTETHTHPADDTETPATPEDPAPDESSTIQANIYDAHVVEDADDLEFVVSLTSASTETVSVEYSTVDGSALDGTDYTAVSGSLEFTAGETRKFVTVPVLDNTAAQAMSHKDMQLVLSDPQGILLDHSAGTGTIIDSDTMPTETTVSEDWSVADSAFSNANSCTQGCHVSDGNAMDYLGEDISPNTQWKHSVMANSFHDPYWQAAVEDESSNFPELAGFIEDTCTTCHAPMGRTHAHHSNTNLDTDGYYRLDLAMTASISREGISCTACHQIDSENLGSEDTFSGKFEIAKFGEADFKKTYGKFDVAAGASRMSNLTGGHLPVQGTHIAESAMCATCHTLYTPSIHPDTGLPTGSSFLEQAVFLEWNNSVYADGQAKEAQCQTCHMPEPVPGYKTAITLDPAGAPTDRTPYRQHTLTGGNTHLLEILRDYRTELGIDGATTAAGFDQQISQTRDVLGMAASLAISTPEEDGDMLEFDVIVTNNTGHKLPAAYPSRRSWLHVTVRDGSDQVIFESGKPDYRGHISTDEARLKADCMSVHKYDGFDTSACYEPHRDVITDESEIAIYETVLGDANGNITHTLLYASSYLKDNRIPPEGFVNAVATLTDPQLLPSGVSDDTDFNCISTAEGCGKDTVQYKVDITGRSGPFTAEAKLLYQATQPAFVYGLHTHGARVNRFKVMYDATPPTVEELASAP
jgi:hypothetical protein